MGPQSASPSALVASSSSKPATAPASKPPSSAPAPGVTPPRPAAPTGAGAPGKDRGRRRRGGRGQGGSGISHNGSSSGPQWPSFHNPWTGSIHMWPGSTAGGFRGPPRAGTPPSPGHDGWHAAPWSVLSDSPWTLLPGASTSTTSCSVSHGTRSLSPARSTP
jgi:hypothetical protein